MSDYVGRRLQSRLQRLERLLNAKKEKALLMDISDEELADRTLGMLYMAECIKQVGGTDSNAQKILSDAAQIEALFSSNAAAENGISTKEATSAFGAGAKQTPASRRKRKRP